MDSKISLDIFDYKTRIGTLLSSRESGDVFSSLLESVTVYYNRPVGSLCELKKRDLKQSVGTTWEMFCADWLRGKRDGKGELIYDTVWTLKEWNERCSLGDVSKGLILGKNDIGIDLIAHSNEGYHAVQCKWRKKGKVTWTELSTFIGLVGRSGPWVSHLIMTNGDGVLWKVRRTKKDISLCRGTFSSTKREHWLSISGTSGQGHKLSDEPMKEEEVKKEEKIDVDKMREARLARFSQL